MERKEKKILINPNAIDYDNFSPKNNRNRGL